jgi:hypothetical protein
MKRSMMGSVALALLCFCRAHATSYTPPNPSALLMGIQYSDLAGVATLHTVTNEDLVVSVKNWWLGGYPSNQFVIAGSDCRGIEEAYGWSPTNAIGRDIVFFAVTNEWKQGLAHIPDDGRLDWDFAQSFTEFGPSCAPKLYSPVTPPIFLVDTNMIEYVSVLSNLTQSVFITRDRVQLYHSLRDAYGTGNSGVQPYRTMAWRPLYWLSYQGTETEVVEMLGDPLLHQRYRRQALFQLKTRFGWPENSTVPEP